jgi:alpha-methylacyl-CoA racemase
MDEAPKHPHNIERGTFVELNGIVQPAPAPGSRRPRGGPAPGARRQPRQILGEWLGLDDRVQQLHADGAVA